MGEESDKTKESLKLALTIFALLVWMLLYRNCVFCRCSSSCISYGRMLRCTYTFGKSRPYSDCCV